jgi:catechol 2,3-dioxygenase-like lactoylglutathione lyase family enzyme
VDDLDAAAAFYGDTLGLRVELRAEGLMIELPGGGRVFVYQKSDHTPASYTVLNLEVPDIDTAVDELAAAGIALERYPGMPHDERGVVRGKAAGRGPDIAWFTDPAGNVISVLTG